MSAAVAAAALVPLGIDRQFGSDSAHVPASAGSMYHVVDQIGAREVWQQGITGAGVTVAVIDTGLAPVDAVSGPGKVVAAVDVSEGAASSSSTFLDGHGHGTHMSGIIAGASPGADPARSASHPEWFLGVAPGAGLVPVKVADDAGVVTAEQLVTGIDWVTAHHGEYGIRVLNLAFDTGNTGSYRDDAVAAAVERAWQAGLVVVTAAGNGGDDTDSLTVPSSDPYVIAVGGVEATDDGFVVADWTSRGAPERTPDLAAPGAHIESLRAPGSIADRDHAEGFVSDQLFLGSGSSQSAAVVAGAAALLLEARPELTNDQVKALLVSTAASIGDADRVGAGVVQIARAIDAPAPTARQSWPTANDDIPVVHTPGIAIESLGNTWTGNTWTGNTWTGNTWTGNTWTGNTWTGNTWTGNTWTGNTWTGNTWTGNTWTGNTWTGNTWTGNTWTGNTWTGNTWTGNTWTGNTWTGNTWTGNTWTGNTWTGNTWTGNTWTGNTWTGNTWTGNTWTGNTWTGNTWTGNTWTGNTWTGNTWTGNTWTGNTWTGNTWTGNTWTGNTWT